MNPSTSAAVTLVVELVRHGVTHVVLAPGSRSAPLAFALAAADRRGDLRLHARIDERSAGFTALGLARASGLAAVVTTSGTAVANLHPAVLEAAHAGVPLLLLTADRPHEVRGTGANQTTDQAGLFGTAPRLRADVPAPHGRDGEAADLRHLLSRAVAAATGARSGSPGPVHLNLAYREPLAPDVADFVVDSSAESWLADPGKGAAHAVGAAFVDVRSPGNELTLAPGPRTVVLAGDRAGEQARLIAEAGGFPLLAEPTSGARTGENAIGPYRFLLARDDLGGRIERVLVVGHPTLASEPSRPVRVLLGRDDVEVIVVAGSQPEWFDFSRRAGRVVSVVRVSDDYPGVEGWLGDWQRAGATAQKAVDHVLMDAGLTGPLVAAEVAAALGPGERLMVGSSNAIRDLDLAASPFVTGAEPQLLANRGLSGIDGTLSTAAGLALGAGRLTRALLGDLAFLHDVNGLLIGPLEPQPNLQIVVLNDDGGGIFALVEYGDPAFAGYAERAFGTPHGADISALCAGYGVFHQLVDDVAGLRAALASPPPGRSVVEVRATRAGLRDLHSRIADAVAAGLDQ